MKNDRIFPWICLLGLSLWLAAPSRCFPSLYEVPEENPFLHPYLGTGHAMVHANSSNSDFTMNTVGDAFERRWRALGCMSIPTSASIAPDGTVWTTTGQVDAYPNPEDGCVSRLRPEDRERYLSLPPGHHVWRLDPETGERLFSSGLVDAGAAFSSPVIDREGNVYVADFDTLFKFDASGNLLWEHGIDHPIITNNLLLSGDVIGIDIWGFAFVLDRETGVEIDRIRLAGTADLEPHLFCDPETRENETFDPWFIDEAIFCYVSGAFVGSEESPPVSNTPAVSPRSGAIYTTSVCDGAGGKTACLVRLDDDPQSHALHETWEYIFSEHVPESSEEISATSPALMPDDRIVVADGANYLHVVRPDGTNDWFVKLPGEKLLGSPSVDAYGNIYTGGDPLTSYDSEGNLRFSASVAGRGIVTVTGNGKLVITTGPHPAEHPAGLSTYRLTTLDQRGKILAQTDAPPAFTIISVDEDARIFVPSLFFGGVTMFESSGDR